VENFGKSKNMKCYEVSAKTGEGLDNVFQAIAELILEGKSEEEIKEEFIIRPHSNSTLSKESKKEGQGKKRGCC
jgi:GTPase SAR1 family protein